MDGTRTQSGHETRRSEDRRLHRRAPVGTRTTVNQPSLWPEPVEVVAENVSLGGVLFESQFLFSPYDLFHCRVVLPGSASTSDAEVRLSALVVRVDDDRWERQGRCGVGALFVGLDEKDEAAIRSYLEAALSNPEPGDVSGL